MSDVADLRRRFKKAVDQARWWREREEFAREQAAKALAQAAALRDEIEADGGLFGAPSVAEERT